MTMRCDHCRGELGLSVRRYWHMRFCCSACVAAYQRRLGEETKEKIRHLDPVANDNVPAFGARLLRTVTRPSPGFLSQLKG